MVGPLHVCFYTFTSSDYKIILGSIVGTESSVNKYVFNHLV
jgi:hypothetical protein